MPTYRVRFNIDIDIEAENEQEAMDRVSEDIMDYYSIDKDYYVIEEVKE